MYMHIFLFLPCMHYISSTAMFSVLYFFKIKIVLEHLFSKYPIKNYV